MRDAWDDRNRSMGTTVIFVTRRDSRLTDRSPILFGLALHRRCRRLPRHTGGPISHRFHRGDLVTEKNALLELLLRATQVDGPPGRSAQWQPLNPKLVVEVRYEHCTGHRFRHGTKFYEGDPDNLPQQCHRDLAFRRDTAHKPRPNSSRLGTPLTN